MAVRAKRAFVPAYYQVAEDLSEDIESGRLRPGDAIPSEAQLCTHYGISRMTVRQGLGLLADAGYISSVPGRGCFVAEPCLDKISIEFREGVLGDGRKLDPQLCGLEVVSADEEVAAALGLPRGAKTVELKRLSFLDGTPVAFERKYLPYHRGKPLVEQEIRYAAFPELVARSCERHLVKVSVKIRATQASAEVAEQLQLRGSSPAALVLEQAVLAQDDRVLGWGLTHCAPDQYSLIAESNPFWRSSGV